MEFFQIMKRTEKARKKANAITETVDVSEKEKWQQIKQSVLFHNLLNFLPLCVQPRHMPLIFLLSFSYCFDHFFMQNADFIPSRNTQNKMYKVILIRYIFEGKVYSGSKFFYTEPISLNKAHSTKEKAFDNKILHLYNHSHFSKYCFYVLYIMEKMFCFCPASLHYLHYFIPLACLFLGLIFPCVFCSVCLFLGLTFPCVFCSVCLFLGLNFPCVFCSVCLFFGLTFPCVFCSVCLFFGLTFPCVFCSVCLFLGLNFPCVFCSVCLFLELTFPCVFCSVCLFLGLTFPCVFCSVGLFLGLTFPCVFCSVCLFLELTFPCVFCSVCLFLGLTFPCVFCSVGLFLGLTFPCVFCSVCLFLELLFPVYFAVWVYFLV